MDGPTATDDVPTFPTVWSGDFPFLRETVTLTKLEYIELKVHAITSRPCTSGRWGAKRSAPGERPGNTAPAPGTAAGFARAWPHRARRVARQGTNPGPARARLSPPRRCPASFPAAISECPCGLRYYSTNICVRSRRVACWAISRIGACGCPKGR